MTDTLLLLVLLLQGGALALLYLVWARRAADHRADFAELKGRLTGAGTNDDSRPAQVRGAVMIFAAGILGIPAPINIVWGSIWYRRNRKALKAASAVHNLLAVIGLALSGLYLVLALIGLVMSSGN